MTAAILALELASYALLATRVWNHINKAAVAVFAGVAAWLLYILNGAQYARSEHGGELASYFLSGGVSVKGFISSHIFVKHMTQACEVVLFLLATIGIAEVLNANKCFGFLRGMARRRECRRTLWTLAAAAFVISANLDNLTTTVLMLVIMHRAVSAPALRMVYGAAIAVAANCGGALTVIGDMNGLALWTRGCITPSAYSLSMALPVIVMAVTTIWLVGRMLPGKAPAAPQYDIRDGDDSALARWQRNTLLVTGIGGLWFIPTFHNITGLPPYVGALCVLSLLWALNEIFSLPFLRSGKMVMRRFPAAAQYENIQTILFFIGVTLISGVCAETGAAESLALWSAENIGSVYALGALWGAASIALDSVVVIMNNINMFSSDSWQIASRAADFGQNGAYWPLLSYFCLFGSSLLTIGSAGGITLMRMGNVSLAWYARKITPKVAAGGLAGTAAALIAAGLAG